MSRAVDLSQRLELRDTSGSLLGYFVPAKEASSVQAGSGNCQQGHCDGETGAASSADLTAEVDRLRQEVRQLRTERDLYLKSLYAATREDVAFDRQAIFANLGSRQPLEQLLEELEATKEP
jgi:hypothetical protein